MKHDLFPELKPSLPFLFSFLVLRLDIHNMYHISMVNAGKMAHATTHW